MIKKRPAQLEQAGATIQKGKQRKIVFFAREMKLTELAAHEWTLLTFQTKRKLRYRGRTSREKTFSGFICNFVITKGLVSRICNSTGTSEQQRTKYICNLSQRCFFMWLAVQVRGYSSTCRKPTTYYYAYTVTR